MSELSVSYLGAACWRFRADGASLLVDPYFTRLSIWAMLFSRAIPDVEQIEQYMPPADAILATHPHYDHLMDVPEAARISRAPVYASAQGSDLLELLGVPPQQICPIDAGDRLAIGPFEVVVFSTPHRLIFGRVPFEGPLHPGLKPHLRAADYRMDHQFSFLIAVNGLRVLLASGVQAEPEIAADVLLVGADATRGQLASLLCTCQPHCVFPNHWDDMFR